MKQLVSLTALAVAFSGSSVLAEELKKPDGFPERTISIIVPFGSGGGSDQMSRAWGSAMTEVTGVPFQVENKPGGTGLAALPDFKSRPKDGYTIFQQAEALASFTAIGQVSGLGTEIIPICYTQATFSQLYMRPDEDRFSDWNSFVEYAKAHPGEIKVANIGVANTLEVIQMGAIQEQAGLDLNEITFDDSSERYASLLGRHTDILFEQPGDVFGFIEAGRMVPFLTLLGSRPEIFADVPSLSDVGLDIPELLRVRGFFTHGDVPKERYEYLVEACEAAYNTNGYQAFNKENFMDITRSLYGGVDAIELTEKMIDLYSTGASE